MSRKRAPPAESSRRKRVAVRAPVRDRADRLQLMALVPDDVLRSLVFPMVFNASPVYLNDVGTLFSLGAPFVACILADDMLITKITNGLRSVYPSYTIRVLRDIKKTADPEDARALCARLRNALGSREHEDRALVTAILDPAAVDRYLDRCTRNHVALCRMLIDGVCAPGFSLELAVRNRLWDLVDTALAPPHNMHWEHRHAYDFLADAPRTTMMRVVDSMVREHTASAVQCLVTEGADEVFEYMARKHADKIDGDALLKAYYSDGYTISRDEVAYSLNRVLPLYHTTRACNSRALVFAIRNRGTDAARELIDALRQREIHASTVAQALIVTGDFNLAEPYLAIVAAPELVCHALRGYTVRSDADFKQHLGIIAQRPYLRALVGSLPFLDGAITARDACVSVDACKEAAALGVRVQNFRACLKSTLERGQKSVARWLLASHEGATIYSVTDVVVGILERPMSPATRIGPALESGLVDPARVLGAVALLFMGGPHVGVGHEIRKYYHH